jgi:hypothetical protein
MKHYKLFFLFLFPLFLIVMPGCKSVINISGTWNFMLNYDAGSSYTATFTFTGDENSGTLSVILASTYSGTGTYTVNDPAVNFTVTWETTVVFMAIGTIIDENNMNGTFTQDNSYNGSWTATR